MKERRQSFLRVSSDSGGGQEQITAMYIRVSTDAQSEEGYSLEMQEQKLRQWCDFKDYHDCELYCDGGWSGSNLERPDMKRMIADIMSHRIKRVVVYKLDRLSRSQKDTIFLLDDVFIPNGIEFYSINENFDTSTPYGKAMIGILSVFAQLERENIRERTKMGMQARVRDGYWMGGDRTPFGYDYDQGQDILVPNEHAQDVKDIFRLYLQGYSTTKLARMFPVSGDRQIGLILDRITYAGMIQYNGDIFQGRHEALIDMETFQRAQRERQRRSTKSIPQSNYLLTGLVYCGKCGAKMRYQKWGKKVKIYCYSQQTSKPNLVRDPNCDNLRCDADELERAVVEDLLSVTDHIVVGRKDLDKPHQERESSIQIIDQKCSALSSQIKRLYGLYADGGDELLLETIKEKQEELLALEKMREDEQASLRVLDEVIDRSKEVYNLRDKWSSLTMRQKQRAVNICIDRIVVNDGNVGIYYKRQ